MDYVGLPIIHIKIQLESSFHLVFNVKNSFIQVLDPRKRWRGRYLALSRGVRTALALGFLVLLVLLDVDDIVARKEQGNDIYRWFSDQWEDPAIC